MNHLKQFENIVNNNDEYNRLLTENGMLKTILEGRDELIYSMVRNTHAFMSFVSNENIGIQELRQSYKTESIDNIKTRKLYNKILQLGEDWRSL